MWSRSRWRPGHWYRTRRLLGLKRRARTPKVTGKPLMKRAAQAERTVGAATLLETGLATRAALSEVIETAYQDGDTEASFYAAKAQEGLLLARLYAERFLINSDASDAQRVQGEISDAVAALDVLLPILVSPQRRELTRSAIDTLAAFSAAFEIIDQASADLNAALARMDGYGPLMVSAANTARDAALTEQSAIGSQSANTSARSQTLALGGSIFALVLAAGVAMFLSIRIPNALRTMTGSMNTLAGGDTSVEIAGERRTDEIGEMARSLVVFRDSARQVTRLQAEQAEKDANAAKERKAALEEMAGKFEAEVGEIVNALGAASGELQTRASELNGVVAGAGERSSSVAAAAEQASGSVEAMASASEELSASIREVASQVGQSAEAARASSDQARASAEDLDRLMKSVAGVDEIIGSINDVAEQTNLLALNATIEAARAGEAGKGFAVVAEEVKQLAGQTQKLTEQIAQRLGEISGATNAAVDATRMIISRISDIDSTSAALSAAVEEQSSATAEISSGAQQAAEGARTVSNDIAGVQEAVSRSADVAEVVSQAATELKARSAALSQEVESFLSTVRAA